MATIIYHPANAGLAEHIQTDLAQTDEDRRTTIVLVSPQANADADVQAALVQAIEHNQRIIPVLASAAPLPKLIEHLEPLDFSTGYDFKVLAARLAVVGSEIPMKVRTPQAIAANRRTAVVVTIAAIFMFVVALYAVGVLGLQAPAEEYGVIETEVIMTRNAYIDAALPHSTEDAANFEPTVGAVTTALRPLLVATATAKAGE